MCSRALIPLLGERVGACPGRDPGVRGLPVARAAAGTSAVRTFPFREARLPPSPLRRPLQEPRLDLESAAALNPSPSGDLRKTPLELEGVATLHPLLGERQVRPSSAETGEGSSAHPASGYAKVSLWEREPVPDIDPRMRVFRAPSPGLRKSLLLGRGRSCPCLPRTRSGVPPSSPEIGEGFSGHPPSGYTTPRNWKA